MLSTDRDAVLGLPLGGGERGRPLSARARRYSTASVGVIAASLVAAPLTPM
jgi:hypothetical protein